MLKRYERGKNYPTECNPKIGSRGMVSEVLSVKQELNVRQIRHVLPLLGVLKRWWWDYPTRVLSQFPLYSFWLVSKYYSMGRLVG
jgi:hypothetical protein